jgi:hypothetical protein
MLRTHSAGAADVVVAVDVAADVVAAGAVVVAAGALARRCAIVRGAAVATTASEHLRSHDYGPAAQAAGFFVSALFVSELGRVCFCSFSLLQDDSM